MRGAIGSLGCRHDVAKGQATLAGALPWLSPLRLAAAEQPLSFDLDVVDVDPSIFNDALGNNTKLGGVIDGHIGLSGTVRDPRSSDAYRWRRLVRERPRATPLTQIVADISFDHASGSIDRASAKAGTGTLNGSGGVEFPAGLEQAGSPWLSWDGSRRAARSAGVWERNARRQAGHKQTAGGSRAALGKRHPEQRDPTFASFVKAATQSGTTGALQIPLAFDVKATAGKNVRMRGSGYGAGLDIGATGSVRLGGTLADPSWQAHSNRRAER